MDFINISIGLAFLAGVVSFLSPCVFALVPAYIGYLGGRSLAATDGTSPNISARWVSFSHGLAFVVGFSIVFIILGVAVSGIGALLFDARIWLSRVGGAIVIIFGLHMTGIIHIRFLEYDLRPTNTPDRRFGYLSSVMMGVFFSAGWSPCVGPVLGAILTLALQGGSTSQAAILLTSYSAGLAIPFLVASLGVGWVTAMLKRHGKVMRYAQIAMGILLIIIGGLLVSGKLALLGQYGTFFDFGI